MFWNGKDDMTMLGIESDRGNMCSTQFSLFGTTRSTELKVTFVRNDRFVTAMRSDKKMIRWWYNRHEDEKYIEVYESAENFINNLILHCPDENFKMVRYYGFYSNRNKKYIRNLKERKKI